jgi:hypothetical protein
MVEHKRFRQFQFSREEFSPWRSYLLPPPALNSLICLEFSGWIGGSFDCERRDYFDALRRLWTGVENARVALEKVRQRMDG